MIAIIDYGMGNLHSVKNALMKIDCECIITNKKEEIQQADGIILPGVGAFYDCMKNLKAADVIDVMKEEVAKGKPLLGICLGMQVLFETGYEVEKCEGLGFLKGFVTLMEDDSVKIPHIGWNKLEMNQEDILIKPSLKDKYVYFVHSYYAQGYDENDLIAYAEYGNLKIPAYVRKANVMGMQYHPEKSGEDGLQMLEQFKQLCQTKK